VRIVLPLCALLGFLVIAFLVDAAVKEVKPVAIVLHHTGAFVMAPATIRFSARIHPIASDREVILLADNGADYYRCSTVTIEGDDAPAMVPPRPMELRDIPPGDYVIVAGIGPDREADCEKARVRAKDEVRVSVIGGH
jgi:hypothetical protein